MLQKSFTYQNFVFSDIADIFGRVVCYKHTVIITSSVVCKEGVRNDRFSKCLRKINFFSDNFFLVVKNNNKPNYRVSIQINSIRLRNGK